MPLPVAMDTPNPSAPAAPRFVPLSRTAHAAKRWHRYADYSFAASQTVVPVVGFEIDRVAASLPVALLRAGPGFVPVAMLGLQPQRNLFVDAKGRWLADYVPLGLRSQPFALGRNEAGQFMLCIEEGSPLIADSGGEPLFTDEGQPTGEVRKTMAFLQRVEQGRAATALACEALARHNCITALAFSMKDKDGKERRLSGLHQVDEAALAGLPDEAFLQLRKAGALPLAYAQLVSLHKLPMLAALAERRALAEVPPPLPVAGGELDLSFLEKGDTFKFDGFR